jgi:FkbM family methyltransferase
MGLHCHCWDLYEKAMKEAKYNVAVDIGANSGGYTATLRQHGFGVIALEPVPKMFKQLKERFKDDLEVVCRNLAMSDKPEIIHNCRVMHAWSLGDPEKVGMSVSPDHKDDLPFDMICDTLDHTLEFLQISHVGIIKLDVDGYEPKVLRGAEKTIWRDSPPILCELSEYPERMGHDPKTFINYIFDLGYKICALDGKMECTTWEEVEPYYPRPNSKVIGSYDVMLLPR